MRTAALWFALSATAFGIEIQQYHSHDFTLRSPVEGNPFDARLDGDFQGPDGIRLRVPGFYDGAGAWKIRFSPTRPGEWSMRTVSSMAALDGKVENGIRRVPNRHPNIHGGLRVDAAHPQHFIYQDGTRYFLLGYEADWLWDVDMNDPERKSMRRLIDLMASRGFDHALVNVYSHDTSWAPGKSCQWDYVIKVYNKGVRWPAKWSADEEKCFRYVVARYQAFSNVVWDFSKKSYNEKDDLLQSRLIDLVRSTDAYHRLTTAHDDDACEWDPELSRNIDFRTDQQHSDYAAMILFDRARRAYPVVNAEFGYEYGVEKLPTPAHRNQCDWKEFLRRAWHIYLAGGYGVYYYNNTAWDVVKPDPEPPGMKRFQLLRETIESLPCWRMKPSNHLAAGGPCLALPGEAYIFYVEGEPLTVNLGRLETPGEARAEWINTWDGAREKASVRPGGALKLRKPASFGQAPALSIVQNARAR